MTTNLSKTNTWWFSRFVHIWIRKEKRSQIKKIIYIEYKSKEEENLEKEDINIKILPPYITWRRGKIFMINLNKNFWMKYELSLKKKKIFSDYDDDESLQYMKCRLILFI